MARVFPGWHQPTNLKWVINPVKIAGLQRFNRVYESPLEKLRVIVAWETDDGWHLSISHPSRYPTWDEIRDARYELLPNDCTMAMLLPPKEQYVNLHPNCFHLHEVPDA